MNERPEFVEKVSSRVRVYTPTVVIEGAHHHPPGVRLSDLLRNQATGEKYMLLTEAVLTAPDGAVSRAEYVLINTAHASVILPLEETGQEVQRSPLEAPVAATPSPAVTPQAQPERQGFGLGNP